jgi:hypothetical protein
MSTATTQKTANTSIKARAQQKVRSEIQSMLQINGNSPTAHGWVPRVVMMTYELRCANNPADGELAECYHVAKELASRS